MCVARTQVEGLALCPLPAPPPSCLLWMWRVLVSHVVHATVMRSFPSPEAQGARGPECPGGAWDRRPGLGLWGRGRGQSGRGRVWQHLPDPVPAGAGQDVGRSCILVSIGGKNVMLDCGMHMGFNDDVSPVGGRWAPVGLGGLAP